MVCFYGLVGANQDGGGTNNEVGPDKGYVSGNVSSHGLLLERCNFA